MVFVPVELGVWLARWRLQLSAGAEQQVEPYFGSLILAASSPSSSRAVSSVQSALVCVPGGGLVPACNLPVQPIHKYNLVVTKRLVARSRSRRALERKALLRQLSLPGSVFGFFFLLLLQLIAKINAVSSMQRAFSCCTMLRNALCVVVSCLPAWFIFRCQRAF